HDVDGIDLQQMHALDALEQILPGGSPSGRRQQTLGGELQVAGLGDGKCRPGSKKQGRFRASVKSRIGLQFIGFSRRCARGLAAWASSGWCAHGGLPTLYSCACLPPRTCTSVTLANPIRTPSTYAAEKPSSCPLCTPRAPGSLASSTWRPPPAWS